MQSGISASQELQAAFQTLASSPDQRGLLCTITKESLTPHAIISPASSSFFADLSLLKPHLQANAALYIILRRHELGSIAPFIAITYVPDSAPVRSKMLFASTRLTLVRELGIEKFRETIFATTPDELSVEGFEKHDRHVQLEAPLTEEEQSLSEVKRREAEEGKGASARRSHVSSGVSMPVSREALVALRALSNEDGDNMVQLKINMQSETIELASSASISNASLSTSISSSEPRYSFYRYKHTHNGNSLSPILFIYTCPSGSKIKERMLYAASSRSAQQLAEEAGLRVEKKIEEGDPREITEESVHRDLHPQTEVKRAFDRPRRPGRK